MYKQRSLFFPCYKQVLVFLIYSNCFWKVRFEIGNEALPLNLHNEEMRIVACLDFLETTLYMVFIWSLA